MSSERDDDESLTAKVRKWVDDHSGMPIESRTASAGWHAGWWVAQNLPFIDPETSVPREIDVCLGRYPLTDEHRPHHEFVDPDEPGDGRPFVEVLVECSKNAGRPWVFFIDPPYLEGSRSSITPDHFLAPGYKLHYPCIQQAHWSPRVSRTWDIALVKHGPDEIFDALTKATKAACSEVAQQRRGEGNLDPWWAFPAVVIDGPLFTATVTDGGKVSVEQVTRVTVALSHQFLGVIETTCVEVLTEPAVPKFLDEAFRLARNWWEHLQEYGDNSGEVEDGEPLNGEKHAHTETEEAGHDH